MKRYLLACLVILILFIILLSGCDISKRVFRSKEKSKSEESSESTGSKRTQLTEDWSMINSSLFHRNGQVWIEFDSLAQVNLSPSGMTAIGYNPVIHGQFTETAKDTTVISSKTSLDIQQDTTSKAQKKSKENSQKKQVEKEQKTQNIAPILVLVLLILIVVLGSRYLPKPK